MRSMISEQVRELQVKEIREFAAEYKRDMSSGAIMGTDRVLCEAANTIESLSAKLSETNAERSTAYYNVEWIPCNERMPEAEQDVLLSFRSLDVRVGYRANTEGFFYVYGEEYIAFENTLAWMPLPEPYKAQDI